MHKSRAPAVHVKKKRIWDGMHVRKIVCNVMNICDLVRNDDTHCSDPRVVYNAVAKQREVNTLRSV
jgi:hypothetical protein